RGGRRRARRPRHPRPGGAMTSGLRFDHAVLPNGLTVIGEHNPRAVTTAVGYMVRAGARDETPDVSGVSHFLEHMCFKGNERYSADDINRVFDELGADYNAYTSEERTVYYGAVTADKGGRLLELLTELLEPSLRQDDFEMEKKVILEEIAMYQDRPAQRLFESASQRYWNGHPLGNSVLGSVESITALTRDAMQVYFDRRYAPSNVLLVLAGNYDWDAMLARPSAGPRAGATTRWFASGRRRARRAATRSSSTPSSPASTWRSTRRACRSRARSASCRSSWPTPSATPAAAASTGSWSTRACRTTPGWRTSRARGRAPSWATCRWRPPRPRRCSSATSRCWRARRTRASRRRSGAARNARSPPASPSAPRRRWGA